MSYNQDITTFLKTQLQATFGERLKQVILFGSRARGDADEDSDYDVLVLLEKRMNTDDEALAEIWVSALIDFNVVIGFFPTTETIFSSMPFEPVFVNVRRDGVLL